LQRVILNHNGVDFLGLSDGGANRLVWLFYEFSHDRNRWPKNRPVKLKKKI
jgi:hypothetical protein